MRLMGELHWFVLVLCVPFNVLTLLIGWQKGTDVVPGTFTCVVLKYKCEVLVLECQTCTCCHSCTNHSCAG